MSLKKFHKMGLAVVGQRGHVFDRDMLGIVFFYIFQDRLQLFQSFGLDRRFLLFLQAVGYEQKEKLKKKSFDSELITFRLRVTEQVDLTDAVGSIFIVRKRRREKRF